MANTVQFPKQLLFGIEILKNDLDHQIAVSKVRQISCAANTFPGRISFYLGQFLLLHPLIQETTDTTESLFQ